MNKKGWWPRRLGLLKDVLLIGPAIIVALIMAASRLGLISLSLDPEHLGITTLLFLISLAVSVFFDRKIHLNAIQDNLDSIIANYTFGARYLDKPELVNRGIERAIRRAEEDIMASGAKSTVLDSPKAIEEVVSQRRAIYRRLITGTVISHELHEPLKTVIRTPKVQIVWTAKKNLVSMAITENECTTHSIFRHLLRLEPARTRKQLQIHTRFF